MEPPITNNKENLIDSFNVNSNNNLLKSFKDVPFIFGTKKDNNECFTVYTSIGNVEKIEKQYNDAFLKAYPLTIDECFEKKSWLNNKKYILVIGLPSNFFNVIKILKTNKNQYFILYKDRYSLKGKEFDAIIVDSAMPYHLDFYKSVIKYIKYKVVTYVLENKILKLLK